jgi:prepilin-type N-terminal cleavage/methylation domain-containing protein
MANNYKQKIVTRGFTLIELLVVIAIIGILSSVVLASLRSSQDKSKDTAIKATLSQVRSQAEVYYSNNDSYGAAYASNICPPTGATMFAEQKMRSFVTQLDSYNGSQTRCAAGSPSGTASNSWAIMSPLQLAGTYWCSDSSGNSKLSKSRWSFIAWIVPDVMAAVGGGPNLGGGAGTLAKCP